MFLVKARTWLFVVLVFFSLSVAAVAVHLLAYSYVPHTLSELLENFASPGELLWWATLGGVFAGYPSDLTGYIVWVLGTTVFWVLATAICVAFGKWIYSTVLNFRHCSGRLALESCSSLHSRWCGWASGGEYREAFIRTSRRLTRTVGATQYANSRRPLCNHKSDSTATVAITVA